ncbi:MAG: hypothetical protein K6U89_13210 [Chloroflexi bacterium]|nr:hypothetical protein [Chloroflexota bacterium]GIW10573.1 MAG: hypothetical protein KatS3mg061_1630 [Dehalococcoidia bacterium]
MTYTYRGSRFTGRDWRENGDWRPLPDDPRVAAAESAISWLMDRGILETVGLAPDGELLLRLSERAWEATRVAEPEPAPPPPPPNRSRARTRRRAASGPKEPPADAS